MRRAELQRLRFEELNLDEGTAIAAAAKVKTRQRRVVEISKQTEHQPLLTAQCLHWLQSTQCRHFVA